MLLNYIALVVIILVLGLIIAYLYIKDKEFVKDMMIIEQSILDIKQELQQKKDEKKDQVDDEKIKEVYKELDSKIYELGESLIKIVKSIKNLDANQKDLAQRVEKIEEQLKLTMISSSTNSNENEIISLYKSGKTPEEIAKEKRIPLGEVELIIKLANLNEDLKEEERE